ncbi:MAG: ABC-type sugar transport system, periplasmic component [Candidatus Peregrinibacteria bacterium GW2011_GWF2_33_10]|nr:MAG: ABC-type sugar transport system, periplasmic component [Candidatus Peregrinibacteria bacterium GW2011_GWF2_33_10]OGJ44980.1 MAG: hypothetical protein A2263_02865 [Candidatus Peregrinibacteria bacterium RIFOXYA2_FULL_33_21]OGJ47454.1 MAG: hypothetical protein A2272_04280 [Candidatus Peregrinibacteria bacterium RIFOXYA12_FULL_33_12]OGJ50723.1 MAG: hypothetical protein A2307_03680 [Candidatus Peregrinibacteria bacterium RIFOXYB2_FULL_33_20]
MIKKINWKFILILALVILLAIVSVSCKKTATTQTQPNITLQVWNVFDDSKVFDPIFAEFKAKYKGLKIEYRKFEDPQKYMDLIVNEMAEGEGPDIFFLQNSSLKNNYKKLTPADSNAVSLDAFKQTFVGVAANDCLLSGDDGVTRLYCMPLYIDNLALYYNKAHFEEILPSDNGPAQTWSQIEDQVYKLTKEDNSFERFARTGLAFGRADNIARAYDILEMLLLQGATKFYAEGGAQAVFATQQGVTSMGQAYFPGRDALDLYTSFGIQSNKQYSWNKYMANPNSAEKEMIPFVNGKVSMIVGYSYLYNDLLDQIELQSKKGLKTINKKDIVVTAIPQVFDPSKGEGQVTLANYFAPVVSRTTQYPQLAWDLIGFLSTKDSQTQYNKETRKPSARRDLIDSQSTDPIYGVFSKQIGYSKTFDVTDEARYQEIFLKAISSVVDNSLKPLDAMLEAQNQINDILKNKTFKVAE